MFDIAPSELLVVAIAALVFIPPKDLPRAMRFLGRLVGKIRGMGRQFRTHFDEMVREAELEEMEKQWREENERIMREHADIMAPLDPKLIPAAASSQAEPLTPPAADATPALPAAALDTSKP